jgi:hypothetical protein
MKKRTLEEGKTYSTSARIGAYKVVKRFKSRSDGIKVQIIRFDKGGEEEVKSEDILAPISFELSGVEKLDEENESTYAFTLGYLARHGYLTADIPSPKQDRFDEQYEALKGKGPDRESSHYMVHKCKETWQYALRMYVPVGELDLALPESVVNNVSNHGSDTKRISDNQWAWRLLAMGFDLGNEHNTELIKASIDPDLIEDFEAGFAA